MTRLTDAQRRVLERIEECGPMYGYAVTVHHPNMEFVIYNDEDDDDVYDVPAVIVDFIINGGYVKGTYNPISRAWSYELTDAGRAALAQEG